jgi:hypothetical protein
MSWLCNGFGLLSRTLVGLSSGILVHVHDEWQRINRWAG